jgi:hypothetical protein
MKVIETLRHRSASSPQPADIRRVIAGSIGVGLGVIAHTILLGRSDWLLFLHLASIMAFGFFGVVLALPAYLLWGRRGDWRRFTVWCGKGLLVVTGLLLLSAAQRAMREAPGPNGRIRALQERRLAIPAFLRAERASSPVMFERRLVETLKSAFDPWDVDASDLILSNITENDRWIRAHLTLRTPPDAEKGDPALASHMVLYYHQAGLATLSGTCSPDVPGSCPRLDRVLASAEEALRPRLAASTLDDVLPEPECSTEELEVPGEQERAVVRLCSYAPEVQLTFTRSDAEATIGMLTALPKLP